MKYLGILLTTLIGLSIAIPNQVNKQALAEKKQQNKAQSEARKSAKKNWKDGKLAANKAYRENRQTTKNNKWIAKKAADEQRVRDGNRDRCQATLDRFNESREKQGKDQADFSNAISMTGYAKCKDYHCAGTPNTYLDPVSGSCLGNVCGCDNGDPVTQDKCFKHGSTVCSDCVDFFHLDSGICEANVCECDNGIAVSSDTCIKHGSNSCSECVGNFRKIKATATRDRCAPNLCKCNNGEAVDNENCTEHKAVQCKSCFPNFTLQGDLSCLADN